MRVLYIAGESTSDATQAEVPHVIESLGHTAVVAFSAEAGKAALEQSSLDLVLAEENLRDASGTDFATWIRGREQDAHRYIVMLSGRIDAAVSSAAFEAGIDDLVSLHSWREELPSRLRVAERILRLETRLRLQAEGAEPAPVRRPSIAVGDTAATRHVVTKPEILENLRTWRNASHSLLNGLTENVPLAFSPTRIPDAPEADALVTRIGLTDIAHKVHIDIFVATSRASATAIACSVLGDPSEVDDVIAADFTRELANGIMGSLKTSFHAEDYVFTAGIPQEAEVKPFAELLAPYADTHSATFSADDVEVTILLGVRSRQNQKARAETLREGMVLAESISDASGAMVMNAGVRLSRCLIDQLIRIDPQRLVELYDPAA